MKVAQSTGDREAQARGWDFRHTDETPLPARALAEILRPRSLVILAVIAGVSCLWWL
jgi:hypothetical protein